MAYSGHRFLVAVDCVIFGFDGEQLQLLLVKRVIEPESGSWSLMGGFLMEDEDLDAAAERVLGLLTGLEGIYMDQLSIYGKKGRDGGGRVLSAVYYALINSNDQSKRLSKNYEAGWFSIDEIPALIFDHRQMVEDARKKLQEQASIRPIGFNLLPEKFTFPQLRKLYEAIFDSEFDKRNFSKRMLSSGALIKQEEKDKSASKRGAYYYKFNADLVHSEFKFL